MWEYGGWSVYAKERKKKEKERERRAKCKERREKERKRKKAKKEKKKTKEITRDRLRAKQTLCARKVRLDYRRQTSRGGKTPSLSDENEKEGSGGRGEKEREQFCGSPTAKLYAADRYHFIFAGGF